MNVRIYFSNTGYMMLDIQKLIEREVKFIFDPYHGALLTTPNKELFPMMVNACTNECNFEIQER